MRAWIIGNGPSLKDTPLDALIGEDTFAVNNIGKIFPYTEWRPKYYVRTDGALDMPFNEEPEQAVQEVDAVIKEGAFCYLGPYFYNLMWKRRYYLGMSKILPADICQGHKYHSEDVRSCKYWHFNAGGTGALDKLCTFGGSLSVAIQMASWKNRQPYEYDEIILLGCDLGFNRDGTDHFCSDYYDHKTDPVLPEVREEDAIAAHKIAKRSTRIPIYNATIGGNLEVYERIDLCQLL